MSADLRAIYNPPGRDQLVFRTGTFATFLADMLARVRVQEIPDGRFEGTRPLALVDLQPRHNWIYGLLDVWAAVGDVFAFYQERLANEGFLRTARQELSVQELIRLLGHPPRPGVASATYLAFTASGSKEMPAVVRVPKGAIVQSVPTAGQLPQTWETSDVLEARAQWNQLRPAIRTLTERPAIRGGAKGLLLAGARTSLKPGAALVLTGAFAGVGPRRLLRIADQVKVESIKAESLLEYREDMALTGQPLGSGAGGGTAPGSKKPAARATGTRVSWKDPLDPAHPAAVLEAPGVFVLRKQGQLFGANATPWRQLTVEQKRQHRKIIGGPMVSGDGGGSWQQKNRGLPANPVNVLLPAAGAGLLAGTRKGLFRLAGDDWQALKEGVGGADVRALAGGEGYLYAGASDGRVWRSTDGGDSWEPLAATPSPRLLRTLLAVFRKPLKRFFPARLRRLPATAVNSLLAVAGHRSSRILAGTDKGVFSTRAQGDGWLACNQGFPGTSPATGLGSLPIHDLAEAGSLFAATDKGLFVASAPGRRWQAANAGLPGTVAKTGLSKTRVLSLLAFTEQRSRKRLLFAGTDQGVFRRVAGGRFEAVNVGLPGADVRDRTAKVKVTAMAVTSDPTRLLTELFAGTDHGLFRSRDLGGSWLAVDLEAAAVEPPVEALAAGGAQLAVAVPFNGFKKEQWPGFFIRGGRIDLSTVARGVVAGGWVALTQAAGQHAGTGGAAPVPPDLILRILDVAAVRRASFGLSALVTRLDVGAYPALRDFDLRQTVVRYQSDQLELFSREVPCLAPPGPGSLTLDPQPPVKAGQPALDKPLPVQRPLIVTGKPARVRFRVAARPLTLDTGLHESQPIAAGDTFQVTAWQVAPRTPDGSIEPPGAPGRQAADLVLELRAAGGTEGSVRVAADQVRWLPAEEGDPTVGQVTWVSRFAIAAAGQPGPRLTVLPALSAAYDPTTVVIYGNAGLLTQGESGKQILGSGDASKANQSFALSKPPLTYLPAATASGLQSTLEVRVDGVLWRQVPSFAGTGWRDRVYVVRRDLESRPVVTFGDGAHGVRLPTGTNNVVATYRSGVWEETVPAHHLSLPRTRPLGLKSVTNPLPAQGGTPPETLTENKWWAPRASRCLGRIVSRSDYQDFVSTFPGITRALLAELTTGARLVLQITIAGIGGRAVGRETSTYQQLIAAIDAVRVPGWRVRIDTYKPVLFKLEARLRTAAVDQPATVERRVRDALKERFSFQNSRFGEIITTSEIIVLIKQVRGVVDVEIEKLYRSDSKPGLQPSLSAREAWCPPAQGKVVPAELLLISPPPGDPQAGDETDGIKLQLAKT